MVEHNTDLWKSFVSARIATPKGTPGAMSLFSAGNKNEHLSFAKHLTAERRVETYVPGKGLTSRWERVNRNNHYLDSFALSCIAANGVGIRLTTPLEQPTPQPQATIDEPSKWPLKTW